MKTWVPRLRYTTPVLWLERLVVVKQKLKAVMLAVTGLSLIALFSGLTVAAAPYASASQQNLWVDANVTLMPLHDKQHGNQPVGYVLTGYGMTTVCQLQNEESYTCVELASNGK